jgi:hypothetical protein
MIPPATHRTKPEEAAAAIEAGGRRMHDALKRERRAGESHSDAILRLCASEAGEEPAELAARVKQRRLPSK